MADKKVIYMDKNKDKEIDDNLEEELAEDELEGVTITSRHDGNIKRTTARGFVLVLVASAMLAAYAYGDSSLPERNITVAQAVSKNAPYTVFDEVIYGYQEVNEDALIQRLDYYEELIRMSEDIKSFELGTIIEGLEKYDTPEQLNILSLRNDIKKFKDYLADGVSDEVLSKDSEDFVRLALSLEAQGRLVNYTIQGNAFKDLADFKLLLLKSKVADCCNFGPDAINNMILTEDNYEKVMFYYGDTGKTYVIRFNNGNEMVTNIMESTFEDQNRSGLATYNYNANMNAIVLDEIEDIKTFIGAECRIDRKGRLELDGQLPFQRIKHLFRNPDKKNE